MPTVEGVGNVIQAVDYDAAAAAFGVAKTQVVNISTIIVPFLVCLVCVLGFFLAFKMPKDYSPKLVARELKKFDSSLDITEFEKMEMPKPEKGEIIYIQVALSILSGFIFGFIWAGYLFRSFKELCSHKKPAIGWALSCFIPFVGIYYLIKALDEMKSVAGDTKLSGSKALYIVFGILFPLLPLNVVALSVMQHDVNKLYAAHGAEEELPQAEAVVVND